jgi:hypothetical protein
LLEVAALETGPEKPSSASSAEMTVRQDERLALGVLCGDRPGRDVAGWLQYGGVEHVSGSSGAIWA